MLVTRNFLIWCYFIVLDLYGVHGVFLKLNNFYLRCKIIIILYVKNTT